MFIYPYKDGSKSAKALSEALQAKRIRREGSRFRGRPNKVVINWGSSSIDNPEVLRSRVINKPESVRVAGNKLLCLKALKDAEVSVPEFTEDAKVAQDWLEKDRTVVVRKTLTGHSGQGITILEKGLDFVEGLCYTVYIPKTAEYRVHVLNGEIIDVQRKIRDPDRDVVDWKVRSHQNGFIFVRQDGDKLYKDTLDQAAKDMAIKAVAALGLDFGAVDILFNQHRNKYYTLEVNCAPGLENTSVIIYKEGFNKFFGKRE